MSFDCSVLTMFPEAFPGPLGVSLIGTAWREQGLWSLETVDIRGFSKDKRGFLDDTPAGGGPGQVMRADVIASALDSVERRGRPLLYMSARGKPLTQARVHEWSRGPGLIVLCGRFEGVDQRVLDARGFEEVAVGDAVLAGGEAAALVLIEACVRLAPGVLGNADSILDESFEDGRRVSDPRRMVSPVFSDWFDVSMLPGVAVRSVFSTLPKVCRTTTLPDREVESVRS
jgi:tRNA (guanine37-N1)-methyltransferase